MNKLFSKKSKKGMFGLNELPQVAILFLLVGVIFSLAVVILTNFLASPSIGPNVAANATITKTITAVSEIPNNWLGLIAIIIAASIVVVIAVRALYGALGGLGGAGGR
jgi:hypothetical protein